MTSQAFTLKEDKLIDSIITPVELWQSQDLCRDFKLIYLGIKARALWDTGATGSSISQGLARHMGLKPIDMCAVQGATGIQQSNIYLIDLILPFSVKVKNLRVTEFLDNGAFEIIVGMDIITCGDFAISNKDEKTTVSFRIPPSDKPIDFLDMINKNADRNYKQGE